VSTLNELVGDAKIVVTCGPGGIGKTTSAAAMGVAIARHEDRRVLVLTVDPAKRLATALGLEGIGNDIGRVSLDGARGELSVAMLDTQASWDSLIRRHAPDAGTATKILNNTLYQNITRRFVQSHDYIAVERLFEIVEMNEFDVIVVDTPPSRNALDFLDAPSRMADFFSSRFLKWLIAPSRTGLATVATKPLTFIADKILGGQFLSDITEFFLLLNSMHDGFIARAREIDAILHQHSTQFVVVSTLEDQPLREAEQFAVELKKRSLHTVAWIVNRVVPEKLLLPGDQSDHDDLVHRLDEIPEPRRSAVVAMVERNCDYWIRVALREQESLARIADYGLDLFTVPEQAGDMTDLAALSTLGDVVMRSAVRRVGTTDA